MEPLRQWVCDVCGEIIKCPDDGYVIWNEDNEMINTIKIVHRNKGRDEDGIVIGCDRDHSRFPLSDSLTDFLGDEGRVLLLSMIDPGPYHVREYRNQISNMRAFVDFFRRLQIPYYEEARLYWAAAMQDGYFADANELWIYLPNTLKELIKQYGR